MKKLALSFWLFGFFLVGCSATWLLHSQHTGMLLLSIGFTIVSFAFLIIILVSNILTDKKANEQLGVNIVSPNEVAEVEAQ